MGVLSSLGTTHFNNRSFDRWLLYLYDIVGNMENPIVITEKAKQVWQDTRTKRPPRVVGLDYTFDFGKYAGNRLTEVAKVNVDYIFWLAQKNAIVFTKELVDEMEHYIIYSKWQYYSNKDHYIEPVKRFERILYDISKYQRYLIDVPF